LKISVKNKEIKMKMKKYALSYFTFILITVISMAGLNSVSAEEAPKVVKITVDDAISYSPPGHFKMDATALIGGMAGNAKAVALNLSTFKPGGGADQAAKPGESIYFVLEGTLTITTPDGDITLNQYDALYRPAGAIAGIINKSSKPVKMLVIFPTAAPQPGAVPPKR
jgi:glyoxylate utilization-related uncharacterized protein